MTAAARLGGNELSRPGTWAHPFFASKDSLTDYSEAELAYITRRIVPALAIFILTALVCSLGQHLAICSCLPVVCLWTAARAGVSKMISMQRGRTERLP